MVVIMEHNGDIKKVLFLIEQGLTESLDEDDSVKPVFYEQKDNVAELLKDLKFKIDSYNIDEGSIEYRKGFVSGLTFSSSLLENLINKIEEKE